MALIRINASLAGLSAPPTSEDPDRGGDELFCLEELWGFTENWSESRAGEEPKILLLPSLRVEINVLLTSSCARARCCCCYIQHQMLVTAALAELPAPRSAAGLLQGYLFPPKQEKGEQKLFFSPLRNVGSAWPLLWKSFRR